MIALAPKPVDRGALARRIATLRATIYDNPYIPATHCEKCVSQQPHRRSECNGRPSPKQIVFLAYEGREALFGGAAGGGKSDALLMAALQYVQVPGYKALLLRRTYKMLMQDDGLIPRAKEWLLSLPPGVRPDWNQTERRFTFPSGATLTFGYYDNDNDFMLYQGGAWHFVGFDELTQFQEKWYRYLFSRQRKLKDSQIPVRMRAASNPGGPGHEWVKKRFVGKGATKFFVPAKLEDNPGLDVAEYEKSLKELDPVTRQQLRDGDWNAYEGGRFHRKWFRIWKADVDSSNRPTYVLQDRPVPVPQSSCFKFAIADPASRIKDVNDPTAIGAFAVTPAKPPHMRDLLVLKMIRDRMPLEAIIPTLARLCQEFGCQWAGIESVSFQATLLNEARRHSQVPTVIGLEPEGNEKLVRATPAIIRCEAGGIFIPEASGLYPWVEDFVGELVQFTGDEDQDAHDDQVDVLAYAVQSLDKYGFGAMQAVEWDEDEAFDDTPRAGGWRPHRRV